MPSPNFVSEAFAFILVLAIPIVAALWRVFSALTDMRLKLEDRIDGLSNLIVGLRHDFELRSKEVEHLDDRYELSVNGLKEKIDHISTRTRNEIERLTVLATDLESFLAKTTEYEPRRRN